MPDRTFVAHVEEADGRYTTFKVDAPTIQDAHTYALEQLDPGETLQGITPA